VRTIIGIGMVMHVLPALSWGADVTDQRWQGIAIVQPAREQGVDSGNATRIQFGQANRLSSSDKAGATWENRTLPQGLAPNGQNANSEAVLSRPLPPGAQDGAVMDNGLGNGVGKLFENYAK